MYTSGHRLGGCAFRSAGLSVGIATLSSGSAVTPEIAFSCSFAERIADASVSLSTHGGASKSDIFYTF
jgi:hypothetical protein